MKVSDSKVVGSEKYKGRRVKEELGVCVSVSSASGGEIIFLTRVYQRDETERQRKREIPKILCGDVHVK